MANIKAAQSGNWSATSTWTGGVVPVSGDNVSANTFTVTVDVNATVANITNATIYGATVGGSFALSNGITLTSNVVGSSSNAGNWVTITGTASATIVGDISAITNTNLNTILMSSSGTLTVTGSVTGGGNAGQTAATAINNTGSGTVNITTLGSVTGGTAGVAVLNSSSSGTISITGNVNGGAGAAGVNNAAGGTFTITGSVTAGVGAVGANNASTGTFTIIGGNITATNGFNAFTSSNTGATIRLSGSFLSSVNGTVAVYTPKFILNSTPLNAKTRYALNGTSTYVDMFTADNSLTQANPTDVRTGVSYASGALTGTLTVPSEGTVSNGVTVGPLMPFTATRSLTTATATLAYSYPYVAGDTIVVTGASNTEWNGTYTIASVISGTSITFAVPVTYSLTAGTGAQMQTVGTAILTAAAIFNTLTSTMTTAGSIGERLANVSTVAVTGQQITSALG